MADSMTMESLPLEMVFMISQHLSAKDLANCCATCHSWREIFGGDILWQPLCNHSTAKYLRVTPCQVKPVFVNPNSLQSTLRPVYKWRLSFMREMHLWKNWQHGNFKQLDFNLLKTYLPREQILDDSYSKYIPVFYTNNILVGFRDNFIDVWDVKNVPELYAVLPFPMYGEAQIQNVFKVKDSDKLVVVQDFVVQVFSINLKEMKLQFSHVFSLEEEEEWSESEIAMRNGNNWVREHDNYYLQCILVRNILLGLVEARLHIWNVENGQKLRDEEIPVSYTCQYITFSSIRYCKRSQNIVIVFQETEEEPEVINIRAIFACRLINNVLLGRLTEKHFIVYSLNELAFLSFHKKYETGRLKSYIIFDQYLAISIDGKLEVYNYLTSELLYSLNVSDGPWQIQGYLSFQHKGVLSIIEPSNLHVQVEFQIKCSSLKWMKVICNKFFALCSMVGDTKVFVNHLVMSEEDKNLLQSNAIPVSTLPLYRLYNSPKMNKSCTKMVLVHIKELTLVSFW